MRQILYPQSVLIHKPSIPVRVVVVDRQSQIEVFIKTIWTGVNLKILIANSASAQQKCPIIVA